MIFRRDQTACPRSLGWSRFNQPLISGHVFTHHPKRSRSQNYQAESLLIRLNVGQFLAWKNHPAPWLRAVTSPMLHRKEYPYSIHGIGVFTYICLMFMVNVGNIYQSHGSVMGYGSFWEKNNDKWWFNHFLELQTTIIIWSIYYKSLTWIKAFLGGIPLLNHHLRWPRLRSL